MPKLPSRKILLQVAGSDSSTHDLVRTHHIGLYPASVKEYLEKWKAHRSEK